MTQDGSDLAASKALNLRFVAALGQRLPLQTYPTRTSDKGQWLLHVGEPLTRLPLIESGQLEAVLHVGDQGNMVIPVIFGAGELAMCSMLFSASRADVDLLVADKLVARWIPVIDIEQCLLQHRELLVELVRFLSQRLREVQRRERDWLERRVEQRVGAVLARVVAETPRGAGGRCVLPLTHEHLAARCGVSRPKLSLALKQLEGRGLVALHRGEIEVLDLTALGALG